VEAMHVWIILVLIALLVCLVKLFIRFKKSIFGLGLLFAVVYLFLFTLLSTFIYWASLYPRPDNEWPMAWLLAVPLDFPILWIVKPICASIPRVINNFMFNNFYSEILIGLLCSFLYFCIGTGISALWKMVAKRTTK